MLLLLLPAVALAADLEGGAVVAMGSVANADPSDNAAIAANPGVIGLGDRYDFQALGQLGADSDVAWGASVMDGQTTPGFAFGLAYLGGLTSPPLATVELPGWKLAGETLDDSRRDHDLRVAGALHFAERRLSLGAAANLLIYKRDLTGSGTTGNVDLGLGAQPVKALVLGAVARNLVPAALPLGEGLEVGGGVRLAHPTIGSVAADLDWRAEDDALDIGAGGALAIQTLRLRAGYRWMGATAEQRVTCGAGLAGRGASLDYGLAIPVADGSASAGLLHALSLTFAAPDLKQVPEPDGF